MRNTANNVDFSENESKMYERLISVMETVKNQQKGYKNDGDFAKLLGVSKQTYSNYKNKNRQPNLKLLYILKSRFPDINTEFIFTGHGDVLISQSQEVQTLKKEINKLNTKIEIYKELMQDSKP